jgi:sigma-B regulation protein RsbU (phosphoserine phosphatase)
MESTVFERIRGGLLEKRHNLAKWLRTAPARTQQLRWGPAAEPAFQAHLAVLDTAIAKTKDHSLGRCQVCHGYVDPELLEMDYTSCVCLDHFSEAERRLLEADLELAQKVQKALLPQQAPTIPGLELAVFSRPAQIVGGDYFDFLHFADGSHGLAIADVAGHGMSASLLMASLQTALHTLVPTANSPVEVLRHLNRFFVHNVHFTTFVTLFLACFDHTTQALTYGNAGHNPPLLYCRQANGSDPINWLQPTGAAIGLVEEFQITTETVTLAQGDILLLYTDGVTEAMNTEEDQFGRERLAALVRQGTGLPAKELVQVVRQEVQAFIGGEPLADDMTIVVGKINGGIVGQA